jgi:regulator of protease activity HflC (stomatin/prohibitin superfamily)
MADDPQVDPAPGATGELPVSAFQQLTQARVPLEDAGQAFSVPDANGRLPIVVLPEHPFRVRMEFVIGGAIAIVVGTILDLDLALRGGLVAIGALVIVLGVFQAFIVAVPEGARALLLKSGRYDRTVGAGRHIVPPWIGVSHVVTVREIPFESIALEMPAADDVRVDLHLLLTFTIVAPEKFVFLISAPDFDQVCQAACLDAIRTMVRAKPSDRVLDLTTNDTDELGTAVGASVAGYGVDIGRVVVTNVRLPGAFMASRESRRLASVQRDEQTDRHALEVRLLADRDALKRQKVEARRERIELEAANDALYLEHLEKRIATYPNAVKFEVDDQRLAVARALATNTRAMIQVGGNGDIADALLLHVMADDSGQAAGNGPDAPAPKRPPKTS